MANNAAAHYLKEIKKKSVGYRPTWEPNKTLQIGDIGKLEDGVFVKWNTLEKMGINLEEQKDEREGAVFDLSTENGVDVHAKAAGKVDPKVPSLGEMDAGFGVEFKRANSILFKIEGYLTHQISNLGEIAAEVLKRYKSGDWDEDLVIINELIEAKKATIMMSSDGDPTFARHHDGGFLGLEDLVIINELIEAKKATIMMSSEGGVTVGLKAKGNVGGKTLSIADADIDTGASSSGKLAINITGAGGITPLYRAVGIKKKFWGLGKTDVGTRGSFETDPFATGEATEAAVEEPTGEDLFDPVEE